MLSRADSVEQHRAQGPTGTFVQHPTTPTSPGPVVRRKPLPSTTANSGTASAANSPPLHGAASCTVAIGRSDDGGIGWMLSSLPADVAASVAAEHPLFQEIRALALMASPARVEALCKHLEDSAAYHRGQQEAAGIMEMVCFLRDLKTYGPGVALPVQSNELRTVHYMAGSIIKTTLLDENVKTSAQMLALEPPQGWPINRSYFETQPIPFAYDAQRYQADFNYRHWVGERALGMTDTTTLEAWHQELTQRYENRPRMGVPVDPNPTARYFDHDAQAEAFFGAMQRHNRLVNTMIQERNNGLEKQATGWARSPGVVGPDLSGELTALPKLPEMHTGTAGEAPPDDESLYLSQTKRFPMARNWTTMEEIFRFPLTLREVHPHEFRHPPTAPGLLFTDRFGVTMLGVMQTPQCSHATEHDIFRGRISKLQGYDQTLASHGITYEDYRRMILGMLHIIHKNLEGAEGRTNPVLAGVKIKKFFDGVTESLRTRGAPVVIKYKKNSKYNTSEVAIRHHPFGVPVRGSLGNRLNRGSGG